MKLQTKEIDGTTYAMVQDGKPVFVDDAGKEIAFDAAHATATITRLNGEAKGHREAKQAAEAALAKFEGIEDPKAALDALKTVANLDSKQLIDAGKAEEVRAAAVKAMQEQLDAAKAETAKATSALQREVIGGNFARSKFIGESLVVPVQMVEATFGSHFSIEDGKMVAKDANGNQIYSDARPGEPATFDEALEKIVNASPYRDNILKGRGQSGSGSNGGAGGGGAGAKTITRADFNGLDPMMQRKTIADGVAVVD